MSEERESSRPQRDFSVPEGEAGSRLETYLHKSLGYSRPTALKAIRKGWVRVEGKREKGARRLSAGETVRITNYALLPPPAHEGGPAREAPAPRAPAALVAAARASLRAEASDYVVSSKPAGCVVHGGSGHESSWCDALHAVLGGRVTPVGRLDRDTSGLLVLSRTRVGARRLFASLKDGSLQRVYTALVLGGLPEQSGTIRAPLLKTGPVGAERMEVDPAGDPAATRFRVVSRFAGVSLLELELETGRTHQIRAHLASRGCPVLGDARYGTAASRASARRLKLERLFLHAGRLEFPALEGDALLRFEDPLPPELARAVATLRRA